MKRSVPRGTREYRHRWISLSLPDYRYVRSTLDTTVPHPDQTFYAITEAMFLQSIGDNPPSRVISTCSTVAPSESDWRPQLRSSKVVVDGGRTIRYLRRLLLLVERRNWDLTRSVDGSSNTGDGEIMDISPCPENGFINTFILLF